MKRWMASMGLFWSALALLAGCGAGAESSGTPNPNPAPAPNASGAALFAQHGCAGCHGANGLGMTISSGTSPDNPPTVIPALTAAATLAELTTIISTSMPPQTPGVCSGTCATQLAQYVYDTFTDKAPPAPTGASLYVERGCAGCHGANGMGLSVFPALTAPRTVAQLTTSIAGTMPPTAIGSCGGPCSELLAPGDAQRERPRSRFPGTRRRS